LASRKESSLKPKAAKAASFPSKVVKALLVAPVNSDPTAFLVLKSANSYCTAKAVSLILSKRFAASI